MHPCPFFCFVLFRILFWAISTNTQTLQKKRKASGGERKPPLVPVISSLYPEMKMGAGLWEMTDAAREGH